MRRKLYICGTALTAQPRQPWFCHYALLKERGRDKKHKCEVRAGSEKKGFSARGLRFGASTQPTTPAQESLGAAKPAFPATAAVAGGATA